jgi:hypothetical protein
MWAVRQLGIPLVDMFTLAAREPAHIKICGPFRKFLTPLIYALIVRV